MYPIHRRIAANMESVLHSFCQNFKLDARKAMRILRIEL